MVSIETCPIFSKLPMPVSASVFSLSKHNLKEKNKLSKFLRLKSKLIVVRAKVPFHESGHNFKH
jgi:hypothetical protein